MIIKERKNQLLEELNDEKKDYRYKHIVSDLITSSVLDNIISNLDDTKTIPDTTCMPNTKKGYLTSNEQFILLLENLIHRYSSDFYFIKFSKNFIISIILKNNKHAKYLLCKNYLGNNKFIPYFNENYKNLICNNFIINLKLLSKYSLIISDFISKSNLDNYIKDKEIDKAYELLIHLALCNVQNYNVDCLFYNIKDTITEKVSTLNTKNKSTDSLYNFYIVILESMIKDYYKKIEAVKIIFNL